MSTTPLITGVDFVTLPITDFDASMHFYGEVLGLPFVKRWGDMPAAEFQAGNLTIAIMDPRAFGSDGEEVQTHRTPLALQVDDVPAARAVLEGRGVEFLADLIDSGTCHQALFRDPSGNILYLHHRYRDAG
jgi:predicted enzyme related to lactoylglutathione lyase